MKLREVGRILPPEYPGTLSPRAVVAISLQWERYVEILVQRTVTLGV